MGARRLPVVCEASAMATRMCPQCGSQYVASVRRCIDCDEMLVDQPSESAEGEATSSSTPLGDGDQVAYELAGWSNQLKVTLEGMLDKAGIRRVWEAGALVVPASDEAEVDVLVATVEGGDEVALATEVEQVAFEIEGLTADELVDLDARLIAAQIAHAWEDTGALLVAVDDEDVVAEMIDDVLSEEADEGGVDGLATHQALTELYVAVDKLLKDPTDGKLVRRYGAAAEQLDAGGVPYGLSGGAWSALVDEIHGLHAALRGEDDGDDASVDGDALDREDGEDGEDEVVTDRDRLVARVRALRERLHEVV